MPDRDPNDEKIGGIQKIGGIVVLILVPYGWVVAGIAGAATGIVVGIAIFGGLAIARGEEGAGVDEEDKKIRSSQRAGGIIAAVAASVGALYGGWKLGWLYSGIGFLIGIVSAVVINRVRR